MRITTIDFSEGSMFVTLVLSLNIQYIPIEAAVKNGSQPASPPSFILTQDASTCAMLQDLNTLRRFAGEWINSTSYQITIAIYKVSTYGTNTATVA